MIIAQITICCDGCGDEYDGADTTAKLIREVARAEGWRVALPHGRDLCPNCMARAKDPQIYPILRGHIAGGSK